MRCYSYGCNKILTPKQATRKFAQSGEYVDLCDECLNTLEIDTVEGEGPHEDETDDDEE